MRPETREAIKACLQFKGGRSRPDKSAPAILKRLDGRTGTILDIGCGRGSFGRIINAEFPGRWSIDGIEVHGEYQKDASRGGYRRIWREDYTQSYWQRRGYDVYLFVDVLEHFDVKTAIKIVKSLRKLDGSEIIASIPNGEKHWHQSPEFEKANPHEAHLFNWTDELVESELGLRRLASNDGLGVYTSAPAPGK